MKIKFLFGFVTFFILLFLMVSCTNVTEEIDEEEKMVVKEVVKENNGDEFELATFAGGCFWCMEAAFEDFEGVVNVISGYSGGKEENPSYEEVSTGKTGHKEAIQVTYDPKKVSYEELLDLFWRQIDPTDSGGQFADRGPQYLTAIFYHDETQKGLAEKSKDDLKKMGKFDKPIVTEILPYENFYVAEEYHQDYSKKRTVAYKIYEKGSGRLDYKKEMWGV